jgi:hypothetical protein
VRDRGGRWLAIAWRVIAPRLARLTIVLAAISIAASTWLWGLERASARGARHVWGAPLPVWMHRLTAASAESRDSAVVAITELVARDWPRRAAADATVLAGVSGVTWRLTDADTLVRAHAVTTLVEMLERRGALARGTDPPRGSGAGADLLLTAVRRTADSALSHSVGPPRRSEASLAVLQLLAALGVVETELPLVADVAAHDSSATVRALATGMVLRSSAAPERRARAEALLLRALEDSALELRIAAIDALMSDPSPSCWSDSVRRTLERLRSDRDAQVRAAARMLHDAMSRTNAHVHFCVTLF